MNEQKRFKKSRIPVRVPALKTTPSGSKGKLNKTDNQASNKTDVAAGGDKAHMVRAAATSSRCTRPSTSDMNRKYKYFTDQREYQLGAAAIAHFLDDGEAEFKSNYADGSSLNGEKANLIKKHNKGERLLRYAVCEGNGVIDPKYNGRIKHAMMQAERLEMSKQTIREILRKCKLTLEGKNVQLLQIRYQRMSHIVCTVHTQDISEIQARLMPTLKLHFAGFAYVLPMFNAIGLIDAIVPANLAIGFHELDEHVFNDAIQCGADDVRIVDFETGTFCFRCEPLKVQKVADALRDKSYKVAMIQYAFEPKRFVSLDCQEREAYDNFIWKLKQIPEIDGIYDTVKRNFKAATNKKN